MALGEILAIIVSILVSAIPLNLAVKLLGGESSLLKVVLVNFVVAVIFVLSYMYFTVFAGLIAFILMLLVYKVMFDIGWIRAILAWLLQFVIAVILILILIAVFGLTLLI